MRLWEWCNAREHGVIRQLATTCRLRYCTLHEIYSEKRLVRDFERAELISKATGGDVAVRELMTRRKGKRPAKRVSKRARLRRKSRVRVAA